MRLLALTALAAVLCAAPAVAQEDGDEIVLPEPRVSAGMSAAELRSGLDSWFAGLAEAGLFNGAILVARDGEEIYTAAIGTLGADDLAPVSTDTRFSMASIGKLFTHVAVAQLIEQGRLSPDDTIGELLPDYPNALSRSATVRQLLEHRAGVSDFFAPPFMETPKDQFASNADYYRFVSSLPAEFAPGEREQYCNGCYVVLGEIIARVTGQTYEQYLAEAVFAPLGMNSTEFSRYDRLPEGTARFTGRPMGPEGELMDVSEYHGVSGSGAGGVYSTVRDMLVFDNALRENRLLSPEMTAQVLRAPAASEGRSSARSGFAGGGPGVNTILLGDGAWTLIILTNRDEPGAEAMGLRLFPLLAGARET